MAKVTVRTFLTFSLCALFIPDVTHSDDKQLEELERYKSEITAAWRGSYINTGVDLTKQQLNTSDAVESLSQNNNEPHLHSNNVNHMHSYHAETIEDSSESTYLLILVYLIGLVLVSWLLMKKLNNLK